MKRCMGTATLVLLAAACGGGGGGEGGGGGGEVTAGCDVPLAGQCATVTTSQATWDLMGGEAAWAEQCAVGASGYAGTVVADCLAANRVGRCAVTYSSTTATAVVGYGYYSPSYTTDQAAEACAALHGAFSGE
jgi:hypothetical protein